MRTSPGAAVKLCLGDLLVMGSNPETASLHMQGKNIPPPFNFLPIILTFLFFFSDFALLFKNKNKKSAI